MPYDAPTPPPRAELRRLTVEITVDLPPRLTGDTWSDGSPKINMGEIRGIAQFADADGNPCVERGQFSTADVSETCIRALQAAFGAEAPLIAAGYGVSVNLKPVA